MGSSVNSSSSDQPVYGSPDTVAGERVDGHRDSLGPVAWQFSVRCFSGGFPVWLLLSTLSSGSSQRCLRTWKSSLAGIWLFRWDCDSLLVHGSISALGGRGGNPELLSARSWQTSLVYSCSHRFAWSSLRRNHAGSFCSSTSKHTGNHHQWSSYCASDGVQFCADLYHPA